MLNVNLKVTYPDGEFDIFNNVVSIDMEPSSIEGLTHAVITQNISNNIHYDRDIKTDIYACSSIVVIEDKDESV